MKGKDFRIICKALAPENTEITPKVEYKPLKETLRIP